jgi:ABC-type glycerol-3-phosphate transport system substrate-binding protein
MRGSINKNQIKLFGGIGILLLIILLILFGCQKSPGPAQQKTIKLSIWGVEKSDDMKDILNDFKKAYSSTYSVNLDIDYQSWDEDIYEETLINKIADGKGPDVAFVKNTWLPKHYTKLTPIEPDFPGYIARTNQGDIGVWNIDNYRNTFVKTVTNDFTAHDKIYAVPLYVDSLGIYYNEDHYRQAGIDGSKPRSTWQGIKEDIPSLAIRSNDVYGTGSQDVARAAIAMGSVNNIRVHAQGGGESTPSPLDNGSDIISLLLLQNGGSYCSKFCETPEFELEGGQAINFFYSFSSPFNDYYYTWSPTIVDDWGAQYMDDSVDAFIAGKVSTIVGYSDLYREIADKSEGNDFNFFAAQIPQFADDSGQIVHRASLASYWGVAVTNESKQKQAGLEFIYFVGRVNSQKAHFKATNKPPAREDLLSWAASEEKGLAPIIRQAQFAETLAIYDEAELKDIITRAIENNPPVRANATAEAKNEIYTQLNKLVTNPGRTPIPPKPVVPAGTK